METPAKVECDTSERKTKKNFRSKLLKNIRGAFKSSARKSKTIHSDILGLESSEIYPQNKTCDSAKDISVSAGGQLSITKVPSINSAKSIPSEFLSNTCLPETNQNQKTKSSNFLEVPGNNLRATEEECVSIESPLENADTVSGDREPGDVASIAAGVYAAEVFSYLMSYEMRVPVLEDFIQYQKYIDADMRIVVVDWMMGVQGYFRFKSDTFHTAVSLLDRTLQMQQLKKEKFQLLGTTALFVAAKYEEKKSPKIEAYVYVTKDTYTAKQIRKMERHILSSLSFRIGVPKAIEFLPYFHLASDKDELKYFANFLVELSTLEYKISSLPPSLVAFAALRVARKLMQCETEKNVMNTAPFSAYESQNELVTKATMLFDGVFELANNSALRNVRNRYQKYFPENMIAHLGYA